MATPTKLSVAAGQLRALKGDKARLNDELTAINKAITRLEAEVLPKLMEDADIDKFTVDGVGTVYLSTEVYVNVLAADRPKLYEWLREQGHGSIVGDWVFPNTLQAFTKEQLNNQVELPSFIKVTPMQVANIRKAASKK